MTSQKFSFHQNKQQFQIAKEINTQMPFQSKTLENRREKKEEKINSLRSYVYQLCVNKKARSLQGEWDKDKHRKNEKEKKKKEQHNKN